MVMASDGWQPLQRPRQGAEAFELSPFARLARAHAPAVAGDTLVTIALAGTLFFSIDVGEARGEVFLYLALTMAPFAVVAPLVGPALDRSSGGRRWMVVGAAVLRSFVCLLMARDIDSLLLFPEAFAMLVLAKGYHVAKSALVPAVVPSDEALVEANSKLSLISSIVGFIAAVPGGLLLRFGGSEWVLGLAAVVFAGGAVTALRIPKVTVAPEPETAEGQAELRGAGVLLAASAMGLLRGVVGFVAFLLAFALRSGDAPTWHFGVVLALSGLGSFAGAALAPFLRQHAAEERIITGALVVVATLGIAGAWLGGLAGAGRVGLGGAVGPPPPPNGLLRRRGGLEVVPGPPRAGLGVGFRGPANPPPRGQPWSVLRPVRDPLPADLGGRRGAGGHPDADLARLPDDRRHRRVRGRVLRRRRPQRQEPRQDPAAAPAPGASQRRPRAAVG